MEKSNKNLLTQMQLEQFSERLTKLLTDLECMEEDVQSKEDRGAKIATCYTIIQKLEDHMLANKNSKSYNREMKIVQNFQKRIEKQEKILIQEGQDLLQEFNLAKLKQILLSLQNEEYFLEIEKQTMENECKVLENQIAMGLKYIQNPSLVQRSQKYLSISKQMKKKQQNQQEGKQPDQDIINQFSFSVQPLTLSNQTPEANNTYSNEDLVDESPEKKFLKNHRSVQYQSFVSQYDSDNEELKQQMMEMDQVLNEDLQNERTTKITELYQEVVAINEIQSEINNLVNSNQDDIQVITEQQEKALIEAKKATKELQEADVMAQRTRRQKIKLFCTSVLGFIGLGCGGGVGAAIGGAGGAIVGASIGKLVAPKPNHTQMNQEEHKKDK